MSGEISAARAARIWIERERLAFEHGYLWAQGASHPDLTMTRREALNRYPPKRQRIATIRGAQFRVHPDGSRLQWRTDESEIWQDDLARRFFEGSPERMAVYMRELAHLIADPIEVDTTFLEDEP